MGFNAKPLVIGHRGAAGLAPENTLASFRLAAALGVHAVELDVHWHAGVLWVIHDESLDRTTNGTGPLTALDAAALVALDAGDGEHIPSLSEVLSLLPPEVGVNIELKGTATAEPTARVIADFPERDVLVSSFNHAELARFVRRNRRVRIAPLFDRWRKNAWAVAHELGAWSVNLNQRLATPSRLLTAAGLGLKVLAYTVNDLGRGRALVRGGTTGIFTDRPDILTPGALAG